MSEEKQQEIKSGRPDWFLQALVSMIDRCGISVGITLSVGGILISGEMIDGRRYFTEFASQMKEAFEQAFDEKLGQIMEETFKVGAEIYKLPESENEEQAALKRQENYIHLTKVLFYQPGGTALNTQRVLWRVRLEAVDGFSMGSFTEAQL